MLNSVQLQGRLTAEPELRHTGNGIATASFRLAVDRDFKDSSGERGADFLPVVCWRGLAETVSRYFRKGQMALVEGRLQTRSYTDRDGRKVYVTEVLAENVYFCGKRETPPPAAQAPPLSGEASGAETEQEERDFMQSVMEEARDFQRKYGN